MKLPRRRFLHLAAGAAALLAVSRIASGSDANAAEIKVLSGGGIRSVLQELVPRFERASGHKVTIKFGISNQLKEAIEGGESFDIAILTRPVPDELEKQGKIATGTLAEIARVGIGVAVRTGAPRPDISTVDAFKSTLLNAKSISHAKESQSGIYFAKLLERLGIAEAVKSKTKPMPGGAVGVVGPVAKGEAELAVSAITDILGTARGRTRGATSIRVARLCSIYCRGRNLCQGTECRQGFDQFPYFPGSCVDHQDQWYGTRAKATG